MSCRFQVAGDALRVVVRLSFEVTSEMKEGEGEPEGAEEENAAAY